MSIRTLPIEAKVVILGAQGVGKTSIVLRYVVKTYSGRAKPTISASFFCCTLDVEKTKVKLQLWDTAGQERFRSLVSMYYRKVTAAIIVYDITNEKSFEEAKEWIDELYNNAGTSFVLCIVGNKLDLEKERKIPTEKGKAYADSLGALFAETSAAQDKGIQEVFTDLAVTVMQYHHINTLQHFGHSKKSSSEPPSVLSSNKIQADEVPAIKLNDVDFKTLQVGSSHSLPRGLAMVQNDTKTTQAKKKKKCCCQRS